MTSLLTILSLWRRRAFWLILAILIALAALAAALALQFQAARYVSAATLGSLLIVPASLQIIGASRVVLRYLERLVGHDATFRALADLRVWFFRRLARSSAGGLGFRRAGDVLARLVGDVEALDGLFLRIIIPAIGTVLLLPVLMIVVSRDSLPAAMLVLVLFLVVGLILPWRAARMSRAEAKAGAAAMGSLRVAALDTLTGLREVRLFGAEGRMLANIQARESALFNAQRSLASKSAWLQSAAFLAAQAAILVIILLGPASPLAAVAALFVSIAAFEFAGAMPAAGILAGQASASADRVLDAAQARPAVSDPTQPARLPASHALTFDHVSFRWRNAGPLVLDQLDLQIPQGSRIAVLGPSGAGKSTLAALLLKLASPESGQIRLGGVDIATLTAVDLRSRIAYLSQTTHIFADTVANNLRLTNESASDDALWTALEAAQLADFVRSLPVGLNSWLDEGAGNISGGQARRLALARTFLSPAPILILDEPGAGLDGATEAALLETLNHVPTNRTILLITHRLMGVEKLDRIWRLANGHLVSATG
ncbi:MAG: thiol reductant ABC exporter subunit CydC [Rhodospirillales bacterium 20-60-12]|nr:MAG: thiol reductant ABC exporter subunit CydC [Rhodospirillales bacterium 20-60-12]HQT66392.1 thiol reductant ABC exporter subunit CydC [Acetobacteraceae bacterium]